MVAPVAEPKGGRHLVLPGIIVAMLGYAIGNYIGYGVAQAVRTGRAALAPRAGPSGLWIGDG